MCPSGLNILVFLIMIISVKYQKKYLQKLKTRLGSKPNTTDKKALDYWSNHSVGMLSMLNFCLGEAEKRQGQIQAREGKGGTNGVSQYVSLTANPDLDAAPPVPRQQPAAQPVAHPATQQTAQPTARPADPPGAGMQASISAAEPPPYPAEDAPRQPPLQAQLRDQLQDFEGALDRTTQELASKPVGNTSEGPYAPLTREQDQGLTEEERGRVEQASGNIRVSGHTRFQQQKMGRTPPQQRSTTRTGICNASDSLEEYWPPPPPPPPAGQFPMIEVAGAEGVIMVHRHWTEADIAEAASSLPHPATVGENVSAKSYRTL
ncbi:MICOS complex subunit mic25a isoform X1 [Salminus brasiliensis]|uniref:MICOS complex subunit mic25a isoform X1 n=1 Tax=Salminus brasiliensis TaxID=930266 RepID=UPI003B82FFD8